MKNNIKETKLIKWVIVYAIIGVLLTSFILTNIFISSKYKANESEVAIIKKDHIFNLKNIIKERIDILALKINSFYENEIDKSKNNLKEKLDIAHKVIENLYENNKHLNKIELRKLINLKIKELNFFKNKDGYFFIRKLSYIKRQDNRNQESYDKIEFIKEFKPLNIYIGMKLYTENIKSVAHDETLKFISKIKYIDNSYIFIISKEGKILFHKNNKIVNVPIEKLDIEIQKTIHKIMKIKNESKNGKYVKYNQPKSLFNDTSELKKISYVKHIDIYNWIIGTGIYTHKLNQYINKKNSLLKSRLVEDIRKTIMISLTVSIIIIIILLTISRKINNSFRYYSQKEKDNHDELTKLNIQLEKQVEKQVNEIRKKDLILNQKSKLTSMGEMLGNIAHQWRQPLSAISTLASGIRVQKDMGLIDDEQLDKDLAGIVDTTIVLSNTIDDFRNFYSPNKEKNYFELSNTINKVLNLISVNIKNLNIELIINVENIKIFSFENELIQVLLNLLNNAKDALFKITGTRLIFIESIKTNNQLEINIYDNAKGIDSNIIDKVFEPYFTTKFKSQGTGIGLYMTRNIIESSLNGRIETSNKTYIYKDNKYSGALFNIKLPKLED